MLHSADSVMKQPAPRRVTWKVVGWDRTFGMIFGLAFFIAWGVFTLANKPTPWDQVILSNRGTPALARLMSVQRVPGMVNRKPVYSIGLSFVDRQGLSHRADLWSYDPLFIAQLDPEKPVAIEYDHWNPARCRFAGDTIGFMNIVSLFACVAGLAAFITSYFSARSLLKLFRNGTTATALVTKVTATSQARKSGIITNVRYEFIPATGKPTTGFYKTTKPPKAGDEILIVYDPRRPWRNRQT